MADYVPVRVLSKAGARASIHGWIALAMASAPVAQPWFYVAAIAWGAIGMAALSRRTSVREMQTFKGLLQWTGLLMAWPVAMRLGDRLFAVELA